MVVGGTLSAGGGGDGGAVDIGVGVGGGAGSGLVGLRRLRRFGFVMVS